MLNRNIFTKIISKFHFQPEVDLLASYRPDPDSMHINAFSIPLQDRPFYTFPHFAVIGKVLHKIVLDVATGIIVVPNWPSEPWYSHVMKLLIVSNGVSNGVRLPVLSHTVPNQRLCILMFFQFYDGIDPSIHFLPLLCQLS